MQRSKQRRCAGFSQAEKIATMYPKFGIHPGNFRFAGADAMKWFWGIAIAVAFSTSPAVGQASYPDRPVRIIVTFTAGSATDITARILAQKLSETWNVAVTVENIPGAGGAVGADRVAKAAPDGYTLGWLANGAVTIVPSLQSGLPYDSERDFAPISQVLAVASIVAVNNELPVQNLAELIALAKVQPGKLSYASPGVGTPQHIGAELLKRMAGVEITHVPYRGAMFTDVIAGRVPITVQNMAAILPMVRESKLRGLAVTSLKRSSVIPELPSVAESGLVGFEALSWFGLLGPVGTPKPIVAKVHADVVKLIAQPELREKFAQLGADTVGNSPEEFGAIIKADIAKWAKVIKDAGIKAE
jgi:tripartite-type tricarboxylate transporter receptor subunit TctC